MFLCRAAVYRLGKVAVSQARAGGDLVALSDMMDGRVAGIRKALDAAGLARVPIMSYAAKMASAFYGPFREAAGSAPQFGDRQSYQMQGTNADEAMREIRLDVDEGADIILVKPALPCLDLIRRAKQEFGSPLAAYQVSGEYAPPHQRAPRFGGAGPPPRRFSGLRTRGPSRTPRSRGRTSAPPRSRCPA